MSNRQRTLKKSVEFQGIGVHSGEVISVEIRPTSSNTGILFQRTDLPGQPYIPASPSSVFDTRLATLIGTPEASVSTIEHLMAAFFGFGIDNAIVALNNAEMPILDGSSIPFLVMLDEAGIEDLDKNKKILVIKNPIEVSDPKDPSRFIRIEPSRQPLISYVIDFHKNQHIGRQQITLDYTPRSFCEEFSYARTFCLLEEVEFMRARGLVKGGSVANGVVVSDKGVINSGGLRNSEEFVRHKVLDCIGDLYLLGMPIVGHVIAHRAGHDLHTALAKKIHEELSCRTIVESEALDVPNVWSTLLDIPKSLREIGRNFANLPTG